MVPAVTRFARTKTALVLAAAGGVVLAAALLGGRRARPDEAPVIDASGVSLTAHATSGSILRGVSDTHLAITIRAPEGRRTARPPVSVAVVLDVSGSMSGEKIEHAKAAARHMIDELGDGDRFALISFSTRAELLMPLTAATPDAKQRATTAIGGMYADGGTNISDGLTIGSGAVAVAGNDDELRRIVLISDGDPRDGLTDPEQLAALAGDIAAHGVSISTVGVGLDFKEQVMTSLSVAGHGNYYFVEDTQQLASMFDHELDSLGQTIASDAELAITPGAGVEVLDVYGYRAVASGGATLVPIADLRAGETRKVVVHVRVLADARASMELASVKLRFRPRGAHQLRQTTAVARVEITEDSGVVTADMDKGAVRQIEEARTAHALEQATDAYEQGDDGKAREILEAQRNEAAQAAKDVGDDSLRDRIDTVTTRTQAGFAAAPAPAADTGRRASKSVRLDAYDLSR